jgi:hypothetical protein
MLELGLTLAGEIGDNEIREEEEDCTLLPWFTLLITFKFMLMLFELELDEEDSVVELSSWLACFEWLPS